MHYFQWNIKSYQAATAHLSNAEDLAYRRLLELYYDTEQPIKPNANPSLSRRLRVGLEELEIVLNEFFNLTDRGWENEYCEEVIAEFRAFKEKQRLNGSKGGRGKKANAKPNKPTVKPNKPNAKPTINNKQETNIKNIKKSIPENFKVSDAVRAWAKTKGIYNIDDHVEGFVMVCKAKGYKYSNWDSAFMNAVRTDWAKLGHGTEDGFVGAQ